MSSSVPSPFVILVRISSIRFVPIRHGHTLAARFILGEAQKETGDIDHTCFLVHDDHAARSHH